ncbi:hypothetical protein A1O3_03075 [Capronia epimyces CBS 606.96]|uniref:Tetrapyrrole biosynthesis uroporphyrinogen III synthase domain-containing protein n=1 Tax=Capronia epimyces CBS 606.96 TaxID=1182542 RepID=W9YAY2_9EURO|nr:uncharacterized protein A1O3_03075 [Capronia epimyces CBS 606.96]EXJ90007.1 hypothetical protein A1O3_03075 [Capronia epimyces CBS 606.96]
MPPPPSPLSTVPVLLLKTRSHPHDAYEEYFSTTPVTTTPTATTGEDERATSSFSFVPQFVPVLEHRPNTESLGALKRALQSGTLGQQYGGMIFTSQRAVEAWAEVVKSVERELPPTEDRTTELDSFEQERTIQVFGPGTGVIGSQPGANSGEASQHVTDSEHVDDDFSFPLYTVGPATSRALNTLVAESSTTTKKASPFTRLRPSVLGAQTGTGGNLAQYILSHYNGLDDRKLYTHHDSWRWPVTSTLGPTRGEPRSDAAKDDERERLRKKGLLFLVGEQRRDIIPKTLMDAKGKLAPQQRIAVDEVEVYATDVVGSFEDDFTLRLSSFKSEGHKVVAVVVFSPQGCEAMLRALGFIDDTHKLTESAVNRWNAIPRPCAVPDQEEEQRQLYVVVTIGPTTRDHLKTKFGFDADVCAVKPSPQGVGEGLKAFLHSKGLV